MSIYERAGVGLFLLCMAVYVLTEWLPARVARRRARRENAQHLQHDLSER